MSMVMPFKNILLIISHSVFNLCDSTSKIKNQINFFKKSKSKTFLRLISYVPNAGLSFKFPWR